MIILKTLQLVDILKVNILDRGKCLIKVDIKEPEKNKGVKNENI